MIAGFPYVEILKIIKERLIWLYQMLHPALAWPASGLIMRQITGACTGIDGEVRLNNVINCYYTTLSASTITDGRISGKSGALI